MGQQHEDGWFPWFPGGGATTNTQGATARGLLKSYMVTGNQAYLDAAVKTGDYLMSGALPEWADGSHRWAVHDPLFLEELSIVTGDPIYSDYVDTWLWQRLEAGDYGDSDWNTEDFAKFIVEGRLNMAGYDIGPLAIAAHLAGKAAIAEDLMEHGILYLIEKHFALAASWDVLGLAGAVYASAVTGYDLNPTDGDLEAYNSTAELAALLAGWTTTDDQGAWLWRSDVDKGDLSNGDYQSTAFALKALAAIGDPAYDQQISDGIQFICSLQIVEDAEEHTGAFLRFYGDPDVPNVQGNGDALAGIGVALGY